MENRLRTYWIYWAVIVVVAFCLRFYVFDQPSERFPLIASYMLCTWIPVIVLAIRKSNLMTYLHDHHRKKWEELTYVLGYGFGGANSFSMLPWLYSSETLGDPEVARLKRESRSFVRLFVRFTVTVFASYFIIIPMLAF